VVIKEEQFLDEVPITKRHFDSLNIVDNLEVTLGDHGNFHGDLQIGEYRSILTETTPEMLKLRLTIQIRDRIRIMIEDIEA